MVVARRIKDRRHRSRARERSRAVAAFAFLVNSRVRVFREADSHALTAAALDDGEVVFGRGMILGVFRADDAEISADGGGVTGGFLELLHELEDAVQRPRRHGDDAGGRGGQGEQGW